MAKKFKLAYLDADTPLLQAALYVEEKFITATHLPTGKQRPFKNQTVFWGDWRTKDAGWLADFNQTRKEVGKPPLDPDSFTIEEHSKLRDDISEHIEEGVKQWDFYIGRVKALGFAYDYKACIGGEGNFRYDIAQQKPYKGHRPEKPILFWEIRQAILEKYGSKIEVIDGCEVDDYLSQVGWNNYQNYKKTGKWEYVIGFIDKDLEMIVGPYFKFNKDKPEISTRSVKEAASAFCKQMLTGDSTDNIPGLPKLTDELFDKYGIRKTNGLGKKTAEKLIDPCETPKEMFEMVVECYKSYYGVEKSDFTTHRGDIVKWNYIDFMEDNAGLLWLRRDINKPYSIRDSLDKLGITLEET